MASRQSTIRIGLLKAQAISPYRCYGITSREQFYTGQPTNVLELKLFWKAELPLRQIKCSNTGGT